MSRLAAGYIGLAALLMALVPSVALARDASFVDPGMSGGNVAAEDSIKVEPKNDIDIGDSTINVARRLTLFFVNQTVVPVKIEKITLNADSSVAAEITNDDCTKQSTLLPGNRCSVELSITPGSPGPWSVEALMTHSGAGRITRAKVAGKTGGAVATERKDNGLSLSTKDIKPVDFGEVEIGGSKVVRTALMVNDSPTPITLYAIDIIEAENGLQKLDQGCAVDMELKAGESCPITLVWTPTDHGQISTDLIIRHSGQLGFAVIPIRGKTSGGMATDTVKSTLSKAVTPVVVAPPPSATDLQKAIAVATPAVAMPPMPPVKIQQPPVEAGNVGVHLIGTVGNRAVLFKPDGTTAVAEINESVDLDGTTLKVVSVGAKTADVTIDGKPRKLLLEAVHSLTEKARMAKGEMSSGGMAAESSFNGSGTVSGFASLPSSTALPATGNDLRPR